MKAIPLIACLALAAAQSRAQPVPQAGASVSATSASPGPRARLSADIKTFRGERTDRPLPSDVERELAGVESVVKAPQSTDADLKDAEKKFESLKEKMLDSAAREDAGGGDRSPLPTKILTNEKNAGRYSAAAQDPNQLYDGMGRWANRVQDPPAEALSAADRSALSLINAPASPPRLPAGDVPSPALDDWNSWIARNGINAQELSQLTRQPLVPAEEPAVGAAPTQTSALSSDGPMSWATLQGSIDSTGISDSILDKMKHISFFDKKSGSTVFLLSKIDHYCYLGVKWMLALVLGVKRPDDLDLPKGSAYLMLAKLKDNPNLQKKLHLLPLDLTTFTYETTPELPARTLLIWNHGCAGFKDDGHIEFTLPLSMIDEIDVAAFYESGHTGQEYRPEPKNMKPTHPVLACSDGCEVDAMAPESKPNGKPNARDANGYRNLIYYAGSKGGRCLSAYVPVREGPSTLDDARTTGQTGDEHGL